MTSTNRSLTALGTLVFWLATSAFAQDTSSKKAVFVSGGTQILAAAGDTVLSGQIKTSDVGDLLIGVSMECSLWTATSNTAKKGGGKSTSTSKAAVNVTVYVDGNEATPGQVVFCEREQEVNLEFVSGTEDVSEDQILLDIFLKTKNANHFNFFYEDPGNSVHTVEVVVDTFVETSGDPSEIVDENTRAVVGKTSLVIEEYNNP
ncbi:MAG TPA: hypothetical protein VLK65_19970 [Vicinamibacteria bacterium]|nr:hypothetical protein [Vicinamibacteria bacterium]